MSSDTIQKSGKTFAVILIVTHLITFVGGGTLIWFIFPNEQIKIVKKTEILWKDKIIYRKYSDMKTAELVTRLYCYDTKKPRLDGTMLDNNILHVNAGLCERDWSRDFNFKVAQKGNWRYYVSVGVLSFLAGVGIGTGATYKIMSDIRR